MKFSIFKSKKLIINMMCFVILASVALTVSVAIKSNKSRNVKTATLQRNAGSDFERTIPDDDITGEEVNIEDLENLVQEEPTEENNTTTNKVATPKASVAQKSNTNTSVPSGKGYYIKVNYGANVVTIYTNDSNGNFTVPVKAMVCSTGRATPKSGTYRIQNRWEWLGLIGGVYGHYSTQIVGNILFHSVPYLEKYNPASIEYWEYDKLGTACSAGCIRLTIADAKWIYNNIPKGTVVEFYSSGDPGPLRKTICSKNI